VRRRVQLDPESRCRSLDSLRSLGMTPVTLCASVHLCASA